MEVFAEPLSRRYRAGCCSWASLCSLILALITIFIPYLWAYTSHSFWLKASTYREQAAVAFNHKLLVQLDVEDSSMAYPHTALLWSTEPPVNALADQHFRAARVMANPNDDNGDARADSFNITVDFALSPTESVVGVQALAFFDYELSDRGKIKMESLAIFQGTTTRPASRVVADGTLDFDQRSLLWTNGGFSFLYDDERLLVTDGLTSLPAVMPGAIIAEYNKRNFTTRFDVPYPVWTMQAPVSEGLNPHFVLEMFVRNTAQTVEYIPNLAEMLKFAWIQYLGMLVIVYALCYAIKGLVFPNQVFETEVLIDQGAYRGPKQHHF